MWKRITLSGPVDGSVPQIQGDCIRPDENNELLHQGMQYYGRKAVAIGWGRYFCKILSIVPNFKFEVYSVPQYTWFTGTAGRRARACG